MQWRVIIDSAHTGAWNMACDEAIMKAHIGRAVPPTLRFYTFSAPVLSIGYFQRLKRDVDLDACRRRGVEVVRRPTGGRAVLHSSDLTYSIVAPVGVPELGRGILESYKSISRALAVGLAKLGVPATLENVRDKRQFGRRAPSGACFDSPSYYELVAGGKKLVGSAQVRKDGVLLQQGSIPLELDLDLLSDILVKRGNALHRLLSSRATSLYEVLGHRVDIEPIIDALLSGFREVFRQSFRVDRLTEREKWSCEELSLKYASKEWTAKNG